MLETQTQLELKYTFYTLRPIVFRSVTHAARIHTACGGSLSLSFRILECSCRKSHRLPNHESPPLFQWTKYEFEKIPWKYLNFIRFLSIYFQPLQAPFRINPFGISTEIHKKKPSMPR